MAFFGSCSGAFTEAYEGQEWPKRNKTIVKTDLHYISKTQKMMSNLMKKARKIKQGRLGGA